MGANRELVRIIHIIERPGVRGMGFKVTDAGDEAILTDVTDEVSSPVSEKRGFGERLW